MTKSGSCKHDRSNESVIAYLYALDGFEITDWHLDPISVLTMIKTGDDTHEKRKRLVDRVRRRIDKAREADPPKKQDRECVPVLCLLCAYTRIYRWLRLLGLSGNSIRMSPAARAGER